MITHVDVEIFRGARREILSVWAGKGERIHIQLKGIFALIALGHLYLAADAYQNFGDFGIVFIIEP